MRNSVLRVAMESLQGSAEDRKGVRDTNESLKDKKGVKDTHGSLKDTNRSPKDINASPKEPTPSKDRKRSLKDMKGAHSPNNSSHLPFTSPALQTLFVSATLRIDDSPATKALSSLMRLIACRGNPRIVVSNDTPRESSPSLLPAGLALFSIATAGDREKEEFLFTYGKQYSGRTLVFFNSIRSDGRFVPRRCGETPLRSPA
jgi:singapore isolate B (sub-type 7) whole genome shotgun sequence assembly, scaffold_10